ncbi:DUF726 domain-containing protein [Arthrobacter sp. CAU 1506]|uniref:DUF726 domain-containing protein n=1 Tax=Arthrobacter sp. CAU 1506 TaxID=2560052 RepID=UPI0010ABF520|nr:DUF726 domain-containing protein [Arthrobacter sp. CAU 1506]TJY69463.1 DUF726 domain-containing protein [Arthrobacter sp. CAU 1506]
MQKSEVVFRFLDGTRVQCQIVSPRGQKLTLSGNINEEPEFEMGGLGDNRALVGCAWAFAKAKYEAVTLPDQEQQKNAEKRAGSHQKVAEWIADLADDLASEEKRGWCSGCFEEHAHRKANRAVGKAPAYICGGCGLPTLPCACPGCKNMAVRGQGPVPIKRYCAEHRHEIPGFAKADRKMGELNNYEEFLKYDKRNLASDTRVAGLAGVGLVAATPFAYFAAPAIGGAVGALVGGYTGAAATSFGLAFLGGGALAVGGLGMAGGTLVITALGASLGCALGASVMNAYLREDKSFHIEMLQGGSGVPVIVCNGFLSESGKGWGEWRDIITKRYADSPVYRVHWGAKELRHLGILGGRGAARVVGAAALREAAERAAKMAARRLGPLAPALAAADLAKNPWHVAKNRAEKTGVILADLLARTNADSYVLVGHSLGARAMVVAAQTLGTKPGGPRIQAIHLLGAAIGARSDWHTLTAAVDDAVYNYHSSNDSVLKFAYGLAQGQAAAGLAGFRPSADRLKNIDVSGRVKSHFDYHKNVGLN